MLFILLTTTTARHIIRKSIKACDRKNSRCLRLFLSLARRLLSRSSRSIIRSSRILRSSMLCSRCPRTVCPLLCPRAACPLLCPRTACPLRVPASPIPQSVRTLWLLACPLPCPRTACPLLCLLRVPASPIPQSVRTYCSSLAALDADLPIFSCTSPFCRPSDSLVYAYSNRSFLKLP